MIEINNLSKSYGINKIFENESITLTNSCIYALVGVNGIGKSTFLNSIIQPSTLDKGSVKIDDIPSIDFTAKYHYAFVPDTKDMFLNLTGKEYLQFVSELYNQKEKFDELLAIYIPKLNLENSLEQTISSYSLGMKQKIYLAGAFMSNAQNIILDEPFNAIDPESTSIIKKILFDLKDTGKMILFSVHNLDLVSNFCDKIIFIDNRHSISGITGAIVSDFMQQNIINSTFCAPIATYMEIAVIKWLREVIGYKINPINNIWDVGGIITYGGTGSNTTAMLLARENFRKNTMEYGVRNPEEYKILIPKGIGHYSIKSASMWIGCGNNVIEVETNDYKYNLTELKRTLEENYGKIMCVVVYAGDSRTMTIDNLKEVYNLVKSVDERIWLHVDACHGFSLAFSKKLKTKIEGIELYDSISTDPHKVLAVPYCISALLVKNPEKMKLITSTSDLIMQEDFAFGQITPFIGSKSWISLKLWFSIKSLGIEGYGKLIEKRCEMAQYLKNKINSSKEFVLLNDVNINSVVFMYVENKNNIKLNSRELNELHVKIYDKLLNYGNYYLHKFTINDDNGIIEKNSTLIPLRYMSGNDNLSKKDIDEMLKNISMIAQEVKNNDK